MGSLPTFDDLPPASVRSIAGRRARWRSGSRPTGVCRSPRPLGGADAARRGRSHDAQALDPGVQGDGAVLRQGRERRALRAMSSSKLLVFGLKRSGVWVVWIVFAFVLFYSGAWLHWALRLAQQAQESDSSGRESPAPCRSPRPPSPESAAERCASPPIPARGSAFFGAPRAADGVCGEPHRAFVNRAAMRLGLRLQSHRATSSSSIESLAGGTRSRVPRKRRRYADPPAGAFLTGLATRRLAFASLRHRRPFLFGLLMAPPSRGQG